MGSPHLPPPPLLDPAWYPDPTARYEARYWDGRRWTSHISHYGATGSDPVLRARWDRFWVRSLGRIILWGSIAAAGYWAYGEYWPQDNRDLVAEEDLMRSAIMIASDLPAEGQWSPTSAVAVTPLVLEVDDEGEVRLPACDPFASIVADGSDEPSARSGFGAADGLRSVGNSATMGGGAGFAKDYLEQLRADDSGACLGALWVASLGVSGGTVASTQAMSEPSFGGDEAVWWRLSGTDTTGAFSIDVVVDLIYVRVDRVVTEFAFAGRLQGVGVDVERDVITVDVARIGELLDAFDAVEEGDEDEDDHTDDADDTGDDQ